MKEPFRRTSYLSLGLVSRRWNLYQGSSLRLCHPGRGRGLTQSTAFKLQCIQRNYSCQSRQIQYKTFYLDTITNWSCRSNDLFPSNTIPFLKSHFWRSQGIRTYKTAKERRLSRFPAQKKKTSIVRSLWSFLSAFLLSREKIILANKCNHRDLSCTWKQTSLAPFHWK